jgi:hypothetical protein
MSDKIEREISGLVEGVQSGPDGLVDLDPSERRPERAKPYEPILGPNAGHFIRELAVIAATFGLFILVALFDAQLKDTLYSILFGERRQAGVSEGPGNTKWTPENGVMRKPEEPLKPGESRIINGATVKRIN